MPSSAGNTHTQRKSALAVPRLTRAKREEIRGDLETIATKSKHDHRPSFERHERKRAAKPASICAYDFETTLIAADDTPMPVYLTAYSPQFQIETRIRDLDHLTAVLRTQFLTMEAAREKRKYVAWNGNRFDAYFIAAALIDEADLVLRPYMTRNKTLRGLRVSLRHDAAGNEYDPKHAPSWEFLDGIAMLGLAGTTLEELLAKYVPEKPKLKVINFDKGETFDPDNAEHRDYAMRDSEGLYLAMTRAQAIILSRFNEPLAVTMGGVCIKIFQAHIPRDVKVEALTFDLSRIVRHWVMRGGFCYCVRRYHGPVWKYDINQAYAAAMRETPLPCGALFYGKGEPSEESCSLVRVSGKNPDNKIPFYYRTEIDGHMRSMFATTEIRDTWITGIEFWQLKREGWNLRAVEHYEWESSFSMREYVDKLERTRTTCDGGPNGPIGLMMKAAGNHSYGKTLEHLEPIEFVVAKECPDDYLPYYGDGSEELSHIFYRFNFDDPLHKKYHQPQIGSHITAHVRMVVRRAALLDPDAWLYADTDCVVFSRDMGPMLDIDPMRYGAWKVEEAGTVYRIIAKKVYARVEDFSPKHSKAKGMVRKTLTAEDFASWYEGNPPEQEQTQLNNFLAVLCGEEMFRSQRRKGTAIEK